MRGSELITFAYLAYLVVLAWMLPLERRSRGLVTLVSGVTAGLIVRLAAAQSPLATIVRDWAPGMYILIGYWLTGPLFTSPMTRLEQALEAFDRKLLDSAAISRFVATAPRLLLEYLELSYVACYPLLPTGFALLWFARPDSNADRFWVTVLMAEFACYGMLPWLPTHPPRVLEPEHAQEARGLLMRRVNLALVKRTSIQVNTLPSGHAAGAVAATLAVAQELPLAGAALGFVAVSIIFGSVLGRYHYAIDAIAGAAVGAAAWGLVWALHL